MNEIKVLISEEEIQKRIKELAKEIENDYLNKKLTIICILKGSTYFTADLTKNINNDLELEFMRVSSYGSSTISSGTIDLKLDLDSSIKGKDVIIVEDIIDTGRTLFYLKEHLLKQVRSYPLSFTVFSNNLRVPDPLAHFHPVLLSAAPAVPDTPAVLPRSFHRCPALHRFRHRTHRYQIRSDLPHLTELSSVLIVAVVNLIHNLTQFMYVDKRSDTTKHSTD